jgi:hypothetical protein
VFVAFSREGRPKWGISVNPVTDHFTLFRLFSCHSLLSLHPIPTYIRDMPGNKVGQEFGAIRSSLPLEKLEPFLEKNVQGYQGPLEVQQFKFGQVSPLPNIFMWNGWKLIIVKPNVPTQNTLKILRPPSSTFRSTPLTNSPPD